MFHILWMIVIGFLAGLIARWIVPGVDAMGFWMTTGLGIVGSIVGGLIGRIFSKPKDGAFDMAGILLSIVGAVIVLYVAKVVR